MSLAVALILYIGLPAGTVAVRERSHIDDTWLGKSDVWCASADHSITCDEDSIIHVRSAFFNRQKRPSCEPLLSGRESGCRANATDSVAKKCDNKKTCSLTAANHAACAEKPYWMIRVVWECVADPVEHEEEDAEEEGAQVILSKVGVEDKVKKDVIEPLQTRDLTVELVPCYRHTRIHQLLHLHFGRLTSCRKHEGCFKISFADGHVYRDPAVAPTEEDLLKGELVTGKDSKWITWKGIGVVRNDFDTWGLCLPKNQGMQYALELFHSLKALGH
mmetsp:Transcript_96783/g.269118  ORF Transcript_96783/g.269118 Transcript_96783/m.269118 type:complete len:275 (+) Transcript_96783:53-877(+)|eukprot:CAMPEP_0179077322 /NCGR_PEP_ID=MMETSP0796-20121207/34555_1 /TAXON_ID=73915 /ORGANISM="Pyrodinium bahamense, Strain pbaha01" /LENGTH=274 /DNA_ID=CAMNT_0020774599 /DNA_START=48 /DNA_END=872 /DNA_ORIENTATION=+